MVAALIVIALQPLHYYTRVRHVMTIRVLLRGLTASADSVYKNYPAENETNCD
jgi:hypothetical protein